MPGAATLVPAAVAAPLLAPVAVAAPLLAPVAVAATLVPAAVAAPLLAPAAVAAPLLAPVAVAAPLLAPAAVAAPLLAPGRTTSTANPGGVLIVPFEKRRHNIFIRCACRAWRPRDLSPTELRTGYGGAKGSRKGHP